MARSVLLLVFILFLCSCKKESHSAYPIIYTGEITVIDTSGALFAAKILETGNVGDCEYGFVWGQESTPDINSSKVVLGRISSPGVVTAKVTNDFFPDKIYFVRSWARNKSFITYGNTVKFLSKGSSSPVIEYFTPKAGFAGTIVIISGKNFGGSINTNIVKAGNAAIVPDSVTSTRIRLQIPQAITVSGPVKISVSVANHYTESAEFFTLDGAFIENISPFDLMCGDLLKICWKNFSQPPGDVKVFIGRIAASLLSESNDTIRVIVPYNVPVGSNTVSVISEGISCFSRQNVRITDHWGELDFADYKFYRILATAFSIGNKGYIGFGSEMTATVPVATKDLYMFDPSVNEIKKLSDLPASVRMDAIGFAVGDTGYVGLGRDYNWGLFSDLWAYYPQSNQWKQKSNFPGGGRWNPVSLAIGGKAYVGFGFQYNAGPPLRDLWEYDPASDNWRQLSSCPGNLGGWVNAFCIGDEGYFGFGLNLYGDDFTREIWKYTPSTDTWTRMADFPGTPRGGPAAFSLDGNGYIAMGASRGILNDAWRYNQVANNWVRISNVPFIARSVSRAFVINNRAYLVTGDLASHDGVNPGTFITFSK